MTTISRSIIAFISIITLISCANLPIENLSKEDGEQRIQFLIFHHNSNLEDAQAPNNRAHYLIGENLDQEMKIIQLVNEQQIARVSEKSYWQGFHHLDELSIAVDMINQPQCKQAEPSQQQICLYPDFAPEQIELLIALTKDVLARNPNIKPTQILGHSDIAATMISEPGPRFPWFELYKQGIGAWYDAEAVERYWQLFEQQTPQTGLIQQALASYGYGIKETGIVDIQTRRVTQAFQAHFLPWQVTGNSDRKTAAVLFALVDKYFPEHSKRLVTAYEQQLKASLVSEPIKPKRGQVDRQFPDTERSTREFVNDRALFKAYKGQGEIVIESIDAISADVFINGQKINIAKQLQPGKSYQYSLSRRTKTGVNTLRVENVMPEGAFVHITIPYPTLAKQTQSNRYNFADVDKLIESDVANGFPGAVLVVLKDGKIVKHSAYGSARKFADGGELLAKPEPMTRDTIFDIASNTKMFATNFAIMKLVSEGKLDVNQPMSHYLPDYHGQNRETRLVSDFMTHQAGYSPQVRFFTRDNNLGEQFFSQDKARTEQLILDQVPFSWGRKAKRSYSDTDYMLLGMLIERLSGKALDDYVEQDIYAQLQLHDTKFNPMLKGHSKADFAATEIFGTTRDGRVDFENVRTYVLQGEVHDEKAFHSFNGVAGHAGLFSTTSDFSVLMQSLLNGGGYGNVALFDSKTLEQFTKPDFGDGTFGLGWRRAYHGDLKWHFGPYASASAYGHTGWTGTVTVIDPQHDLAIAMFTNARHTKIEETPQGAKFKGKMFESGNYGSIMALIYEAVLEQ